MYHNTQEDQVGKGSSSVIFDLQVQAQVHVFKKAWFDRVSAFGPWLQKPAWGGTDTNRQGYQDQREQQ